MRQTWKEIGSEVCIVSRENTCFSRIRLTIKSFTVNNQYTAEPASCNCINSSRPIQLSWTFKVPANTTPPKAYPALEIQTLQYFTIIKFNVTKLNAVQQMTVKYPRTFSRFKKYSSSRHWTLATDANAKMVDTYKRSCTSVLP